MRVGMDQDIDHLMGFVDDIVDLYTFVIFILTPLLI